MLRESAKTNNVAVDLRVVTNPTLESGIAHGAALLAFADAVTGTDVAALRRAREAIIEELGAGVLVEVAGIAANFSMNDRAANATGIPMDGLFFDTSADYRRELGINNFPSARNSLDRAK